MILTKTERKNKLTTISASHTETIISAPALYSINDIQKLYADSNKIYGLLARGIPNLVNTATLNMGNLKGKYGENIIGSMLNILALENEDCYVFHSVSSARHGLGETDHILLYKNKLILIETKTYSNFKSFKVNKGGDLRGRRVGESNTLRKLDNNNLIQKVREYEKIFGEYNVHAITAVTRSDVQTTSENGKYKVASLTNILQNIDYHMVNATPVPEELNKESIIYLASHCLSK